MNQCLITVLFRVTHKQFDTILANNKTKYCIGNWYRRLIEFHHLLMKIPRQNKTTTDPQNQNQRRLPSRNISSTTSSHNVHPHGYLVICTIEGYKT